MNHLLDHKIGAFIAPFLFLKRQEVLMAGHILTGLWA
jgi:hypothetical protein